jgi:hypothetical protein
MRRLLWVFVCMACGNRGVSGFDASVDGNGGGDAGVSFTLTVTPTPDSETVTIGLTGKTVQFHALRADMGSTTQVDVTSQVTWAIGDSLIGTSSPGGVVQLLGVGGSTTVTASLGVVNASAALTVKATGSAYLGGTTSTAAQTFMSATPDPNPANAVTLQYPLDGVVLPGNLPPIEFQWTQTADNDLYRVHLTTASTLDVYLYTSALDAIADTATWTPVMETARDTPTTWDVDSVGPSNLMRTSSMQTMTPASDTIDDSAIYVWQSSTGTFHVIDMIQETDTILPTNASALQSGQPCAGCHRISRDGTRFSYTFNGGNFEFGALSFDTTAKSFNEVISPSTSYRATYATFNPLESTEVPAMLVTEPDNVPLNTAGTVRLNLRDPDTNAVVPSNITTMLASLPTPNPGGATSMPDWSPDGSFVVFAAYNSDTNYVRELGDDIVLASIVEAPVSYAGGSFTFGTPQVLVAANSSDDPDTGVNNFLPSISPDGSVVAFTRAAGWWSIKTQTSLLNLSGQIMMVRRSDNTTIELVNGSNGVGTTLSSTWPQWAPTIGKKYAWLAYGSERPYGHELTPQNHSCGAMVQGQQSCKQLWVMAIDVTKMASGTADPSFAPFWVPGQSINAQYVSPQWTKAVLTGPH